VGNGVTRLKDPYGLEPGFGSPGGRSLTDDQKKELFRYTDEELKKERKGDKEMIDAASDVGKSIIIAGIPAAKSWTFIEKLVWNGCMWVVKKVWQLTDPGEKFPSPSTKPEK